MTDPVAVPLIPTGVANANNRVYTAEAMAKTVAALHGTSIIGTMGIVELPTIDDSAFKATGFRLVHDCVMADVQILDTPKGRTLIEMMSNKDWKDSISFSPVGFGQINDKGEVYDYTLTSIAVIPAKEDAFRASS
jgi:hypothetical protein